MIRLSLLLMLVLWLISGCAVNPADTSAPGAGRDQAPGRNLDPDVIADAVPQAEPGSRYGNPHANAAFDNRSKVMKDSARFTQRGIASWYGTRFHGRRTSSGEPYDMYAMTAAHKRLPLSSYVRVTNLQNGRQAVVKVNDRGPFHEHRVIDLSYAAATKLGILAEGTGLVEIEVIDSPEAKLGESGESTGAST